MHAGAIEGVAVSGRGTILVAEDDAEIAALLHEALELDGYRVLLAPTIAVALEILAAFRVRLVIADGFRAQATADPWASLAPLVARARTTPVILCSAHNPATYADYAARGFAAFLPKPFDLDALSALVAALLARGMGPTSGAAALES